jgi:hypothetical protein
LALKYPIVTEEQKQELLKKKELFKNFCSQTKARGKIGDAQENRSKFIGS